MTDDLIARLATDLKPVRAGALAGRLALAVVAGAAVSAVLMWAWLGLRPDMAQAAGTPIFWIKSAYTLLLGLLGVWGVERLARAGGSGRRPLVIAVACFAIVAAAAAIDYALASAGARGDILMGASASVCPFYIVALSVPFLAANIAFMRRLTPTNLPLAGAAAGLSAGALGAWIYSFHCTEQGLPFLASWYSLGIVAVVAVGALLGRPLLRW